MKEEGNGRGGGGGEKGEGGGGEEGGRGGGRGEKVVSLHASFTVETCLEFKTLVQTGEVHGD